MREKIKASVGVLTLNSASEISKTLESLRFFEDVYICDGNSTDNTQEIARSFGARIEKQVETDEPNQKIKNFGEARTKCLNQGLFDWHVRVDSDEHLSEEVVGEISKIVSSQNPHFLIYKVPRKYVWRGKVIDDTITYPNRQIRFFNRKVAPRFEKLTHERLFIIPGNRVGVLKNPMYVPLKDSFVEFDKQKTRRALEWDRLQYERYMNLKEWVKATIHTSLLLTLWFFRLLRVRLISRGHKFPISYELWRFKYQTLTWFLATRTLFEKVF